MAGVRIATLAATDLGGEISTLGPAAMGDLCRMVQPRLHTGDNKTNRKNSL